MRSFTSFFICFFALFSTICAEEDDHDHGEEHWEWAGLFQVSSIDSIVTFELRNTGVNDPSSFRAQVFITTSSGEDEESFEEAEEVADESFETAEHNNSAIFASGSQVLLDVENVYELAYSNQSWVTPVTIRFPSAGYYVIFTNHHLSEICGIEDHHTCFRDQTGAEVELLLEEGSDDHGHDEHDEDHDDHRALGDRWLYTMVGCFLVWMVVFSGLVFMVLGTERYHHFAKDYLHLMNLFASGAIFATVLFLILIEAYHFLVSSGSHTESQVAGMFGSFILAGFLSPTIIEILVYREEVEPNDVLSTQVVEMVKGSKVAVEIVEANKEKVTGAVVVRDEEADLTSCGNELEVSPTIVGDNSNSGEYQKTAVNDITEDTNAPSDRHTLPAVNRTIISLLGGDFLHNFCDGIFIGVAAKSCSLSLMWAIVFATMFHEFAQEVSDFVILTRKIGLSIPQALTLNAIAGFSVVFGGILTTLWDVSDFMIGLFLAYGSGNLIYLSVAELFPLLHTPPDGKSKVTKRDKAVGVLCFCFGAFVIGLTLLKHEHCAASGDGEDDGHGH